MRAAGHAAANAAANAAAPGAAPNPAANEAPGVPPGLPAAGHTPLAPPPVLWPMTQVLCQVGALVSLGPGPHGERRYVPLGAGTVCEPELNGTLVEGGVDWQIQRADGVLEIAAHDVIRAHDGALIEVRSDGLRHGPAPVMAQLARAEAVPPDAYFFRTVLRFCTGAPQWQHLNKVLALAVGQREAARVRLDFYRIG